MLMLLLHATFALSRHSRGDRLHCSKPLVSDCLDFSLHKHHSREPSADAVADTAIAVASAAVASADAAIYSVVFGAADAAAGAVAFAAFAGGTYVAGFAAATSADTSAAVAGASGAFAASAATVFGFYVVLVALAPAVLPENAH